MAIKCPDCNSFNRTQATSCQKCGAELNPKTVAVTADGVQDKPPVPWYKRMLRRGK